MNLFKNIKMRRQINKSMKEHTNRKLDIQEILSREYSDSVVADAYEYCMRKCEWNPSMLSESNVRDFLLCILFVGEVNNGGIFQFLSNSSGDMAEETVSALENVGEHKIAKLLKEALQYFPNGVVPKDCDVRNALMEQFDETVEEQFDKSDQIIWNHDFSQSCYKFLQAHKNDFLYF